jgi:hypothetical protein
MNNIASVGHMFNTLNHSIAHINMDMETLKRDIEFLRSQSLGYETNETNKTNETNETNETNKDLEDEKKELFSKVSKTEFEALQTSMESITNEVAMLKSLFPRVSALETKEAERSLQPRSLTDTWTTEDDIHRIIDKYLSSSIPPETFKVDIQLPSTIESVDEPKPEQMLEAVAGTGTVADAVAGEKSEPLSKVAAKATKGTRGRGRNSKKSLVV